MKARGLGLHPPHHVVQSLLGERPNEGGCRSYVTSAELDRWELSPSRSDQRREG